MAYTVIDVADYEWYIDKTYPVPPQYGPLRRFDKEMRCQNGEKHRRCGSSTFFKLNGTPLCMIHAIYKMNEMLYTPEEAEAHNNGG